MCVEVVRDLKRSQELLLQHVELVAALGIQQLDRGRLQYNKFALIVKG